LRRASGRAGACHRPSPAPKTQERMRAAGWRLRDRRFERCVTARLRASSVPETLQEEKSEAGWIAKKGATDRGWANPRNRTKTRLDRPRQKHQMPSTGQSLDEYPSGPLGLGERHVGPISRKREITRQREQTCEGRGTLRAPPAAHGGRPGRGAEEPMERGRDRKNSRACSATWAAERWIQSSLAGEPVQRNPSTHALAGPMTLARFEKRSTSTSFEAAPWRAEHFTVITSWIEPIAPQ